MARLLTILAFVLALGLSAALAVPPLLDWSSLKPAFTREASARLGVPVGVTGPMSVQVLPVPVVSAQAVRADLASGEVLTVKTVSAELDWASVLGGAMRVVSLTVDSPRVTAGAGGIAPDPWIETLLTMTPDLERIRVADGVILSQEGAPVLRRIRLDWRHDERGGRFTVQAKVQNAPLRASGSVRNGASANNSPAPKAVRLSVTAPDHGISLRFTGATAGRQVWPLAGDWTIAGDSVEALGGFLAATLGTDAPETWPPVLARLAEDPLKVTAKGRATPGLLQLSQLQATLAGQQVTGEGRLAWDGPAPVADLDLNAQTVAVEQLADPALVTPSLDGAWLDRWHDALIPRAVPGLPAAFDLTARVRIATLLWDEAVIQNVQAGVRLRHGLAGLAEAGATFPGGARVRLSGLPERASGAPVWRGQASLSAPHPRAVLETLGVAVERTAPGSFGALDAAAQVLAAGDRLSFTALDAQLGTAALSGGVDVVRALGTAVPGAGSGAGPSDRDVTVRLRMTGFDAETLTTLMAPDGVFMPVRPLLARSPVTWLDTWPERLRLGLDLSGEDLTLAGKPVEDLSLAGSFSRETAILDRFDLRFADGAVITAAGAVPQVSGQTPRPGGRLSAALTAPSVRVLTGAADGPDGPVTLDLTADAAPDGLAATVGGVAGPATLDGAIALVYPGRETPARVLPQGTAILRVDTSDGQDLAALLGFAVPPEAQPPVTRPGRLRAAVALEDAVGDVDFMVETPAVTGSLTADLVRAETLWRYDGQVMLRALSGAPLGLPEGTVADGLALRAQIEGEGRRASLSNIEGRAGTAVLEGGLTVDWPALDPEAGPMPAPLPRLTGTLDLRDVIWPMLTRQDTTGADGEPLPPWSTAPLPVSWLSQGEMDVAVSLSSLSVGLLAVNDVRFAARLDTQGLRLEDVTGRLAGGRLSGSVVAVPVPGGLEVALDAGLAGARPYEPVPDVDDTLAARLVLQGDVTAQVTAQGRSVFDLISGANGTVTADFEDVAVAPLDLEALATDWPGLDSLSVFEAKLNAVSANGLTRIGAVRGTLPVTGGVVTLDGLSGEVAAGPVAVDGRINLAAFIVDLETALPVAADAEPLRLRVQGPLDDPERVLDAADLRYDLALRIKRTRPGRISEEDLPAELRELLDLLDEDGTADQP